MLLDVHMPDGGGRAVIEAVHAELPEVRFLALSVSDAAEDVIDVIRAGARGYVTKTISPTTSWPRSRRVHDGDAVFSPRLAGFVLDAFSGRRHPRPRIPSSTCSPPASARCCATSRAATPTRRWRSELGISIKTVETHVSAVLRKLQLSQPPRAHPLGHRSKPALGLDHGELE